MGLSFALHRKIDVLTAAVADTALVRRNYSFATVRLLKLSDLIKHGKFPRFPNWDIVVDLHDVDLANSFIVFISHVWMRAYLGTRRSESGRTLRAEPDSEDDDKFNLVVEGVTRAQRAFFPSSSECYVWMDFCCLDQDEDPRQEFMANIDRIVRCCDCIFTPIHDLECSWEMPDHIYAYHDYKAKPWYHGATAYLNRGWCRLETFYFSNADINHEQGHVTDHLHSQSAFSFLAKVASGRSLHSVKTDAFTGAFHFHASHGRKPHLVFGSKELRIPAANPIILPPLQNTYFQSFHPEDGFFTHPEQDKPVVEHLAHKLLQRIKVIKEGYVGDLLNGRRHGYGVFYYHNGNTYEGNWDENVRVGHGKMTYANGEVYAGQWERNLMHGKGHYKFANGDLYVGNWREGMKNGHGKITYANGNSYEGDYMNDKIVGNGVYKYATGDEHIGARDHGRMHGEGEMKFANGDVFKGRFWNNKMDGEKCSLKYANGDYYEGAFAKGMRTGKWCTMHYRNGDKYSGGFAYDRKNGVGHMEFFNNGNIYAGEFKHDKRHGPGKMTYKLEDGGVEVYDGNWEDDQRVGRGLYHFANGDIYDGDFHNDMMNGVGVLNYKDGTKYEGNFRDGLPHGQGKFIYPSGTLYDGGWEYGKRHGKGVIKYVNGDAIFGVWKDGEKI